MKTYVEGEGNQYSLKCICSVCCHADVLMFGKNCDYFYYANINIIQGVHMNL